MRQFVLKVHGRCDLACDYCYVFTKRDQRWRTRPAVMSHHTVTAVAARIAEHARTHRLRSVDVVLHGGEPLLAGAAFLDRCASELRSASGSDVRIGLSIQTNAVRLGAEVLDVLLRHGVRVGVSLDGTAAAHDRYRRHRNGQGSHADVAVALRRLMRPEYRSIYGGLLCAVDLRNDPVTTYEALLAFEPPSIDFLLPNADWSSPPPAGTGSKTPYAEWLIQVFDRWYGTARRETRVRYFEELVAVLLGGVSRIEGVGLGPAAHVVVETDGSIELSDTLTTAYEGASATGLHVARDPFDAVLDLPEFAARQAGAAGLPGACRRCPIHRVCGGGLHAHRYRAGHGFDNPSVYCRDLLAVIGHVRSRVVRDVRALRERGAARERRE